MAKKNLSGNESALDRLQELCRRVEDTYGKPVKTANQFETLAISIQERTGTLFSATTLKRIWGYLNENVEPRISTLDVLARYCGWESFAAFVADDSRETESGNVGGKSLRADKDVRRGERVRLMWNPGRVCVIEYTGGGSWRVVSSEGTRLNPGDTFRCMLIVAGEPLYLDNLVHEGCKPGVYVCGRRSGVDYTLDV